MGDKVTLSPIVVEDNSSYETELNDKLQTLADEFDNVVYRDGTQDASGNLNMNSKKIINLGAPTAPNHAARLADIQVIGNGTVVTPSLIEYTATNGVTTRTLQEKLDEISLSPEDHAGSIQDALDAVDVAGGGVVRLAPGTIYESDEAINIPSGVELDGNSSKIVVSLNGGSGAGLIINSNSAVRRVHIEVDSTGAVATQAGIHAAIRVGVLSGEGTPSSPAPGDSPSGWRIQDVIVETDKPAGAGIQICGGASHGVIDGVTIPSNNNMWIGIGADWMPRGALVSLDTPTAQNANKVLFLSGAADTAHPHNIVIRNINIGAMTNPNTGAQDIGSSAIRLSGCFNIIVENVFALETTYQFICNTGGDLGFEFAPAYIKPFAAKGIVFRNAHCAQTGKGYSIYADTQADNVARAADAGTWGGSAYVPIMDPNYMGDAIYENITTVGPRNSTAGKGAFFLDHKGGIVRNLDVSGAKKGIWIDQNVKALRIEKPHIHFCEEDGIFIDHGIKPEDIVIVEPDCHDNGDGVSFHAGIYVGNSKRVVLIRPAVGKPGAYDPSQQVGIRVMAGAEGTILDSPHIRSAISGGYGMIIHSGTGYNAMGLLTNPRYDTGFLTTKYAGLSCVPIERNQSQDGRVITRYSYYNLSGDSLNGLSLQHGDRIEHTAPSGGVWGKLCTVAGTVGSGATLVDLTV